MNEQERQELERSQREERILTIAEWARHPACALFIQQMDEDSQNAYNSFLLDQLPAEELRGRGKAMLKMKSYLLGLEHEAQQILERRKG